MLMNGNLLSQACRAFQTQNTSTLAKHNRCSALWSLSMDVSNHQNSVRNEKRASV